MNKLAENLNKILEGTSAFELLSDYGKRMFFPSQGIVAQAGEAKKFAKKYNATVGMAVNNGNPIQLSGVKDMLPGLTPAEAVSYAPTPGIPTLRELWKKEIYRKNPSLGNAEISLPLVTPGLTGGISQIAEFFLQKGRKIVIPDMYWGNYNLIFSEKVETEIVLFPFFTEEGGLNIDAMISAMKDSAVDNNIYTILNFPNNPTGYSPSKAEAAKVKEEFLKLAEDGYRILSISDDAYFGLFYEQETYKESIFAELANLHPNIVAVKADGTTKEHFVWGFRLGFLTFAGAGLDAEKLNAIVQKVAGGLRGTFSNSSMPAQNIMLKAMSADNYEEERKSFDDLLEARYKVVRKIISNKTTGKALTAQPFNSGYFMNFIVDGSAEELRQFLLKEYGIGTISIRDKYLRVAFSSVDIDGLEDLYSSIFEAADKLFSSK
jgi:aspartate/methionine/tyrosine aminotransferase